MLRKIPFNSNLISIGNSPHYDGQLVYSDGRVAYGWQYNMQQPTIGINRATAGLWVYAERIPSTGNSYYVLMDENLNFSDVPIRGIDPLNFSYFCYPWVCNVWYDSTDYNEHGIMILDAEHHYEFIGDIVTMNNNGEVLTIWNDNFQHYWLTQYANDGSIVSRTDTKALFNYDIVDYFSITAGYSPTIYSLLDPAIYACATVNGGYVTAKDPQHTGQYLHFYCGGGLCVETSLPTHMQLSAETKLMIPSLDLVVNNTVYSNDPLQLLDPRGYYITNVNGVHAYKDIVISQFNDTTYGYGFLFKNGTLYDSFSFYNGETGEGVYIYPRYCWSLAEIPGGQWYINYNPW